MQDSNKDFHHVSEQREIDGIAYYVYGSGQRTVVLLRGLGRWSEHWLGFDKSLAASGLRVIAIDNRGFGKSQNASSERALSIHALADDVALVIAKEAPAGAHVVGVSLGGMIGMSLAAHRPQLVKSLMIVNSSVSGSRLSRLSRSAMIAIGSVLLKSKNGYARLAKCLLGENQSESAVRLLAEKWSAIDAEAPRSMRMFWSQLIAAKCFTGQIEMAALRCPVTVIVSDKDRFVAPENSIYIHKHIHEAEMLRHPTAGHELAFEDPTWFANAIVKNCQTQSY